MDNETIKLAKQIGVLEYKLKRALALLSESNDKLYEHHSTAYSTLPVGRTCELCSRGNFRQRVLAVINDDDEWKVD